MSRVGKSPITVPTGVSVTITDDVITVSGSKGTLSQFTMPEITVVQQENQIIVTRANNEPKVRAKHGLMRALINNMVVGVTDGFSKQLEINGVGYRAAKSGNKLTLALGYSHPIEINPPAGISFEVDGQTKVSVLGHDKELVGQIAAEIRSLRKPEPYKGKGVKYANEVIRRKAGKAGKVGAK